MFAYVSQRSLVLVLVCKLCFHNRKRDEQPINEQERERYVAFTARLLRHTQPAHKTRAVQESRYDALSRWNQDPEMNELVASPGTGAGARQPRQTPPPQHQYRIRLCPLRDRHFHHPIDRHDVNLATKGRLVGWFLERVGGGCCLLTLVATCPLDGTPFVISDNVGNSSLVSQTTATTAYAAAEVAANTIQNKRATTGDG